MTIQIMLVDGRPIRSSRVASRLRDMPGIELIATAESADQAIRQCASLAPDLVALAPDQTSVAGFEQLRIFLLARGIRLMTFTPDPGTANGAEASGSIDADTFVDWIATSLPGRNPADPDGAGLQPLARAQRPNPCASLPLVCIGASTGGLPVLQQILEAFPEDSPPTVIVQHIRGDFAAGVASRLDRLCRVNVMEAYPGAPLRPGRAYLAPGDRAHLELRGQAGPLCQLVEGPKVSGHRPSVDALFMSAARLGGPALIGVLLTGMGRDGARGLLEIRRQGGHTIAQDSATSTVYGMPRAAAELGAAEQILPAHRIADSILELCAHPGGLTGEAAR